LILALPKTAKQEIPAHYPAVHHKTADLTPSTSFLIVNRNDHGPHPIADDLPRHGEISQSKLSLAAGATLAAPSLLTTNPS
jgi:hypothetical protein